MVLFTGKTVEEAIEKGLQELGLSRLKAHIKVISKEKKGFLGFGKKPAQVDIEGINEKTVYKADKKAVRSVPEEINRQNAPVINPDEVELEEMKAVRSQDRRAAESDAHQPTGPLSTAQSAPTQSKAQPVSSAAGASQLDPAAADMSKDIELAAQEISDYVTKIIYEMDIEASIERTNNRRQINLQIETPEAGRVIGYHGKVFEITAIAGPKFLT